LSPKVVGRAAAGVKAAIRKAEQAGKPRYLPGGERCIEHEKGNRSSVKLAQLAKAMVGSMAAWMSRAAQAVESC
jgi:hypothetical protein